MEASTMSQYQEGPEIESGKTKSLLEVDGDPNKCIIRNNNAITANDDPSLTKSFASKAIFATNTTCNSFELLEKAGIPTAFIARHTEDSFVAKKTEMIPLEVIIRRYFDGSSLKRCPHLKPTEGKNPKRSSNLVFELFLKTTGGACLRNKEVLLQDVPVEDPFIINPYDETWDLYQPKQQRHEASANLEISIIAEKVLQGIQVSKIEQLTRKVFLVLEGAWKKLGYRYVDFKIEFGIDWKGHLVVSDVIDSDSARLRTPNWKDVSKQSFRDGSPLAEVEGKYNRVSILSNNLPLIPEQAIILWRGSPNDKSPEVPNISGISVEEVTLSAHKKPALVLEKLNELEAKYPQGAVIIAMAGMSNGLGPILSAQTIWPVINCPPSLDEHPEDVWSSLRLPSNVPAATVVNPKNAVLNALNILSMTNPIAYMHRQYEMEEVVNS
ncbi:hypothetical protein A9Q91_00570 [Candidatus Gracilibacteria bacterium 28_42_T64]|nr:hypothetical protein A9Q91_00570 [Candidatus Gracilibacteria bacterium 28_42_T64]